MSSLLIMEDMNINFYVLITKKQGIMDSKEIIERQLCGDARVFNAIEDAKKNDTSFTDRGLLGIFTPKYSQTEVRKIWFDAMTIGIREGLRIASVEGQIVEITNNCKDPKHKEFLEKFYKLADEYKCAIQYHPTHGMLVIDRFKMAYNE